MNTNNFEEFIDEVILLRGFDYCQSDRVKQANELDDGVFSFLVSGMIPPFL